MTAHSASEYRQTKTALLTACKLLGDRAGCPPYGTCAYGSCTECWRVHVSSPDVQETALAAMRRSEHSEGEGA